MHGEFRTTIDRTAGSEDLDASYGRQVDEVAASGLDEYRQSRGDAVEDTLDVDVELTVDLVKKRETPWPRIENADWIMSVGAGRPLEDAARVAFKDMVAWIREKTGLPEMDAYEFVSQNARAPIVQMVDPEYTVLVKISKKSLPKREP